MKKVLIFDCWLPGFTYLSELSEEKDVEVLFVHSSSLQIGDPAKEYKMFLENMNIPIWVKDFSEFQYCFDKLFNYFKPDAILVLSLHHIETRTALRFAKQYKIPSFFIPHGIFLLNYEIIERNISESAIEKLKKWSNKIKRVIYYTKFFWIFDFKYINKYQKKRNILNSIEVYIELIFKYNKWQWMPSEKIQKYYGRIIDNLLIYSSEFKIFCIEKYGIMTSGSSFIYTGTLDVMRVMKFNSNEEGEVSSFNKHAYFISSPSNDYYTTQGMAAYVNVVKHLRNLCVSIGCSDFYYRPHPGESRDFTESICGAAGVSIDYDRGFSTFLRSEVVCGTSSSMLLAAVAKKMKIVTWRSNRLTIVPPYYEPLKSYPKIDFDADTDSNEDWASRFKLLESDLVAYPDIELKNPLEQLCNIIHRL